MRALTRTVLGLSVLGLVACSSQPTHRSVGNKTWPSGNRYRDDLSLAQSRRYHSSHDSVPDGPPPDFSKLPEPVPRAEPLSLYGNKTPYTVLGHRYKVLPTAHGYVERGTASYYGSKFHRYKTSTLEDYDMYDYSAAHKTLPLPSYVRVTNLANGKSVVVRVNDRGPFKDDRLIDLSYIAAVKIGIWPSGTGQVEVRALDPVSTTASSASPLPVTRAAMPPAARSLPVPPRAEAVTAPPPARNAVEAMAPISHGWIASTPVASAVSVARTPASAAPAVATPVTASQPAPAAASGSYLQAGAFGDRVNAERLAARLRAAGISPVQVVPSLAGGRPLQRVRVGPIPDPATAATLIQRIQQLGLPTPRPALN